MTDTIRDNLDLNTAPARSGRTVGSTPKRSAISAAGGRNKRTRVDEDDEDGAQVQPDNKTQKEDDNGPLAAAASVPQPAPQAHGNKRPHERAITGADDADDVPPQVSADTGGRGLRSRGKGKDSDKQPAPSGAEKDVRRRKRRDKGKKKADGQDEESESGEDAGDPGSDPNSSDYKSIHDPNAKPTHAPIRRILGERPGDGGRTHYLVDRYPQWVGKQAALGPKVKNYGKAMDEWDKLKEEHAINFWGRRVYKANNPTSDDSAEQIRLMIDAVLRSFRKHFIRNRRGNVVEVFKDEDWLFHKPRDEVRAAKIARDNNHANQKPSAEEVMRFTYDERRQQGDSDPDALLFANVRVRWVGEIDAEASNNNGWPQSGSFPWWYLQPLFSAPLADKESMKCKNWRNVIEISTAQGHEQERWHVQVLRNCAKSIFRQAPYLPFKARALIFVSLFLNAREMEQLIRDQGMRIELLGDDDDPNRWEARVRSKFLYRYMRYNGWEMRAIEQVDTTFASCQSYLARQARLADKRVPVDGDDDDDDQQQAPVDRSMSGGEPGRDDLNNDEDQDEDDDELPPTGPSRATTTRREPNKKNERPRKPAAEDDEDGDVDDADVDEGDVPETEDGQPAVVAQGGKKAGAKSDTCSKPQKKKGRAGTASKKTGVAAAGNKRQQSRRTRKETVTEVGPIRR